MGVAEKLICLNKDNGTIAIILILPPYPRPIASPFLTPYNSTRLLVAQYLDRILVMKWLSPYRIGDKQPKNPVYFHVTHLHDTNRNRWGCNQPVV